MLGHGSPRHSAGAGAAPQAVLGTNPTLHVSFGVLILAGRPVS